MLEVHDWGLAFWSLFEYEHWSLKHPWFNFWHSILILKVQRTSMSFKSSFGALEYAGWSLLGFGILILSCILSLVFYISMTKILALYLIFEGAQNIHATMSFKSSFGALEYAGCSWLGFGILILIWIWSLVFGTHIFQILALYLDFEGAKNIHVL